MDRNIFIKHTTGDHLLKVPEETLEDSKELIVKCLKGELSVLTAKGDDGVLRFFPAELLRNSLIVFDVSEIDKQVQVLQKIQ